MKPVYVKYMAVGALVLASTAVLAASGASSSGSTAANAGAIDAAMKSFQTISTSISTKLVTTATRTLFTAMTLQMIFTYSKEIFSGDLTSHIAKFVGLLSWTMGGLWAIKNTSFLSDGFAAYINLASDLAGISGSDFTPSGVVSIGSSLIKAVNHALAESVGGDWLAIGDNLLAALSTVLIDLLILICYFVIALSLFVANLEFWMMFSVAPLALGLVPLSAFRDQGMAPLKGAISIGLRLLILGVVVAVSKEMTTSATTALSSFTLPKEQSTLDAFAALLAGLFGCALMAIQSGKIASSIASGSASFSGSDAIRGGMAMAGAAGVGTAAVAALGGSALGTIKAGANPAGKATGHALKALSAAQDFLGGGKASGGPAGGGAGTGGGAGGASAPGAGFGGPAVEQRPSPGSDKPSSGSDASSGSGDASTASIGGAGSGSSPSGSGGSSALQNLGSATRGSAEALGQDNATVGVQMHVGKD